MSTLVSVVVIFAILLVRVSVGEIEVLTDFTGRVVYAINAGGYHHMDSNGIFYEADPLEGLDGIASDFGQHRFLTIGRVDPNDAILYQTERYSSSNFGYDIPVHYDGDYVLVLKFAEVYFMHPRRKVFDVKLNRKHVIVQQLDIFMEVGHGNAHDEIVPFRVSNGVKQLTVSGATSAIVNNKIRVDFIKGPLDNPKINAIYLFKGTVEEIPRLAPLADDRAQDFDRNNAGQDELEMEDEIFENLEEYDEVDSDEDHAQKPKRRYPARPVYRGDDPYEESDVSKYAVPIAASLICVICSLAFRRLVKSN